MKFVKYILRNATRNKVRTLLTVLSVLFCLALMTVLYGYLAMQDVWSDEASKHHRIVVMNNQGFAALLPIANVDKVRKLLKRHNSRYTKIMGSEELGEQFGVIGYPTYFLVDPEGRIRGKYIGKIEEELPRLRKDIAELRRIIEAEKEDE